MQRICSLNIVTFKTPVLVQIKRLSVSSYTWITSHNVPFGPRPPCILVHPLIHSSLYRHLFIDIAPTTRRILDTCINTSQSPVSCVIRFIWLLEVWVGVCRSNSMTLIGLWCCYCIKYYLISLWLARRLATVLYHCCISLMHSASKVDILLVASVQKEVIVGCGNVMAAEVIWLSTESIRRVLPPRTKGRGNERCRRLMELPTYFHS